MEVLLTVKSPANLQDKFQFSHHLFGGFRVTFNTQTSPFPLIRMVIHDSHCSRLSLHSHTVDNHFHRQTGGFKVWSGPQQRRY